MTAVYREVKILQEDLKDNEVYDGPINGRFDLGTFNGVKALINSGKLGDPIDLPDPSEDTYGSAIAAFADELNYTPPAVNAVRTAYSEWARSLQTHSPAVLSDLGFTDPAVTNAVVVLQRVLRQKAGNYPAGAIYSGPLDGYYSDEVERGFHMWAGAVGLNMADLLSGKVEIPGLLPAAYLRMIASARNANGFGKPPQAPVVIVPKAPSANKPAAMGLKTSIGTSKPAATGLKTTIATGTKTSTAINQAKTIANVAKIATKNAQAAAINAVTAKGIAVSNGTAAAQAAAAKTAADAQAKASAAQAVIDAANAAAEAARLRAVEDAAAAQAAQDTTNQAAANQAYAAQAAADQAALDAAAKVAAAQTALQYAQSGQAYYDSSSGTDSDSSSDAEEPAEQPSEAVTPAQQPEAPVEIKTDTPPAASPWTKRLLYAGLVAAVAGSVWWYYKKHHVAAETADFGEGDETPCPCSQQGIGDDE